MTLNKTHIQQAWTWDIRGRKMAYRNAPTARRTMMMTAAVSREPLLRLPRFPRDRAIHWIGPRSGTDISIWTKDTAPTTGKPKIKRRIKRQRIPWLGTVSASSGAKEVNNASGSKTSPALSWMMRKAARTRSRPTEYGFVQVQ